ncbi:DUF6880 family protein [Variovorax sp. dw_954]|uniref:DUF6880 family protein n=1 Tax=unclassified Variovorax TaxID=663243 RepID=UPI0031F65C93
MPPQPSEDLESFLNRQDPSTLVGVLIELANDDDAVRERLERLQLSGRPDMLAAGFRKSLNAWRRSSRFVSYGEASDFGRTLEAWLDQVHRELFPKDPAAALALFESFIEADGTFFERADDSDGCIGDAVRAACRHWLQAASQCEEAPASDWPSRLVKLFGDDQYGARDELLRRAELLLDEKALRALAAQFESRMAGALVAPTDGDGHAYEVFKISAALSLLAEALHDPDVMVRGVLSYSPKPNAMQQKAFADAYLEADRPSDALAWLQRPWGHMEDTRQRLESDALGRLGRHGESAAIRQRLFEQSISVFDLHRWLEQLPEASRPEALQRARQLALGHEDPATAATLLLDIGDDAASEAMLLGEPTRIRGDDYGALVPLAQALRTHRRLRGEAAIYRALLTAILARAYARAYGHAARYWMRLGEIAATGMDLLPLESHEVFEAAIRSRHARKVAFWAHVNGKRSGRVEEDGHEGHS